MSKFIVLASTSDDEYSAILSCSHPKKDVKQFNKDWAACSERVCKIDITVNPVNTCEEQYRLMGKRGWVLKELPYENVVTLP